MFQMDEYLWLCDLVYESDQETQNENGTGEKKCDEKETDNNTPDNKTEDK